MEGKDRAAKLVQVSVFTVTRALFIGSLGLLAGLLGTAFLGVQKGVWIAMGSVYVLISSEYARTPLPSGRGGCSISPRRS